MATEINETNLETSLETSMDTKVPTGTCVICGKVQEVLGSDGLWIAGTKWHCDACRAAHKIRSYPVACEWCGFDDVVWHQGNTYDCPRCNLLKIGKYLDDKRFAAAIASPATSAKEVPWQVSRERDLREMFRNMANKTSTYIESHGSISSPDIVEMSEDRTHARLKPAGSMRCTVNLRQVEGHDMKNTLNRMYEGCVYSYAVCESDEVKTDVEMAMLITDMDFDRKEFSLNFKKVPRKCIVRGNTCFANNDECSLKKLCHLSTFSGMIGNGAVQFHFEISFTTDGNLLIHSKSGPACKPTPFVSMDF